MTHPLEQDSYRPKHPPLGTHVPEVVAKWGKRSQLRWFARFGTQLGTRKDWGKWYCASPRHRGLCCFGCEDEAQHGYGVQVDGFCCCRDERVSA
ncbi:hypothetical protein [Streptomyces sp. NPDC001282]|uniref:hypothetical protein n=1 Tax=Streptomyces sp. NPDC001282 TaxID=3364557 RepID=UPI00367EA808